MSASRLYFRTGWILVRIVTRGLLGYFLDRARGFDKVALRRHRIADASKFGK